jgi:hypothetical protein
VNVVRLAVEVPDLATADSPGFDGSRPATSSARRRARSSAPATVFPFKEIGLGVDKQIDVEKRARATAFPRRLVVL